MEGLYHVWFSTKGRKPALEGEVGEDIKRLLVEIAQRTRIQLLEAEVVVDHAHLLVAVTGNQKLPSIMHQLKGASARVLFLRYPELKVDMEHESFWQRGYGWRRIGVDEVSGVRAYIRTQRQRPLRRGAG